MTRYILTEDQPLTLTDRSTGDTATTTKYGVASIVRAWYGALVEGDPTVGEEIDKVISAVEDHSDLSGSTYLGLSVTLGDGGA